MSELRNEPDADPVDDLDLGAPDEIDEQEPLEPDAGAEPEPQPPEQPAEPRQPRRTQNDRLRSRLAERDRELAEMRGRIAVLERPAPAPAPDPGAQAAQEQAYWAGLEQAVNEGRMTNTQAMQQVAQRATQQFRQDLLTNQLTTRDQIDKQHYDAQQVSSKLHRDYAGRVEETLRSERASGNLGATRSAILAYLVGQDAIARASATLPQQRRAAAARVAGQQARPTGAGGDGARPQGNRQPEAAADEAMLRNLRVGDL